MAINNIGRISDYVKNGNLEKIWNKNKNLTGLFKLEQKDSDNSLLAVLKKQHEDMDKQITMSRIQSRLKTGQRLSPADKEYLKKNSPELYEKVLKIEIERDEFRRALEKCKTKEEADKLHSSMIMMFHSSVKSPNGSQDAEFIEMRVAAINKEYIDFMQNKKSEKSEDTSMPSVRPQLYSKKSAVKTTE